MGVDTYLYLLDGTRYDKVVSVLDNLIAGGDSTVARTMFEQACSALSAASSHRQFPWTPIYGRLLSGTDEFERCIGLVNGKIPATYQGDRGRTGKQWTEEDFAIRNPLKVREYFLRDNICGVIVEGLCVPWELPFPPVHRVTWCLGNSLYKQSKKFEDVLCAV